MQTTATRRVAALVLIALMIAATMFAFASAFTATDEQAGTRIASFSGSREST